MKDWNVQIGGDQPFPFLVIDNWFDKQTEKAIWSELDYYLSKNKTEQLRAENTIVAHNEKNEPLGRSYRWYIDRLYTQEGRTYSTILQRTDMFQKFEFHEIMQNIKPQYRSFTDTNRTSTIISYYENNDYYKPHHDAFQWTSLIWFYKEPKKFTGGDLKFTEPDYKIDVKHNRMVMFPCYYLHEVLPVKIKDLKDTGHGRWTLTHFFITND